MCATVSKFEEWRSNFKEKCLRLFVVIYKHVLLWFWCWLLNTLCIQTFFHIALTNCELHRHICIAHYNVLPGAILLLFTVNTIVYKQKSMTLHMWLSIHTFLQNFMALSLKVFELCLLKKKKKKMMNKTPYHSLSMMLGTMSIPIY